MPLDQCPDAVGIIGLTRKRDSARAEMVEQRSGNLPIMCLPCGQAETDREPLRVNDAVDFGREPATRSPETMVGIPFFIIAACWWARTEVLSII
jgi:hypothetical protein